MQTLDEYKAFLAEVAKSTGLSELIPDEDGLTALRVDNTFILNLQFITETKKVLCFVELMKLPANAPREVYRSLLAGGLFGKDTAGGYFALEDEDEVVLYNYLFDADTVARQPEEFVRSLEDILQLCELWLERIKALLNTDVPGDEIQLKSFQIRA